MIRVLKGQMKCFVASIVKNMHRTANLLSMQHTYQEGLEKWQELHSAQLQCLIQLVAL